MVVTEGQAVHAAAGVSRADLQQTADIALARFVTASGTRPRGHVTHVGVNGVTSAHGLPH
ncbi:hypothetical protein AB0F68_00110 [Micromonospora sp. NPDC023966]|uniref:hypothetical protein n=1 Tax=Micromonospora sp. NPDC023966 TaxID=3154699 RepID=UPI0033D7BFFA